MALTERDEKLALAAEVLPTLCPREEGAGLRGGRERNEEGAGRRAEGGEGLTRLTADPFRLWALTVGRVWRLRVDVLAFGREAVGTGPGRLTFNREEAVSTDQRVNSDETTLVTRHLAVSVTHTPC